MGIIDSIRIGLSKFSGEDYTIIQKCNRKIQIDFALIGFLVVIILMCCFVSALYFTDKLFHNYFADILVGLVWGYVVTNLYILLLYTISPSLLPRRERKHQKIKTSQFQFSVSMWFRIFMVILLAVIIAQPLNVLFLKPETNTMAFDIKYLLSTNPIATVNTAFVVGVFLLPVYLKYNIRNLNEFYERKAQIKKRIIEDDYRDFKVRYAQLLEGKIRGYNKSLFENMTLLIEKLEKVDRNASMQIYREIQNEMILEEVEKYEHWENPPYRTEQKNKRSDFFSEHDLLAFLYPESD